MARRKSKSPQRWEALFLFVFLLILLYTLLSIDPPDQQFCEQNPEQCVCIKEELVEGQYKEVIELDGVSPVLHFSLDVYLCSEYHRMTREELKEGYCTKNPSDTKNCICEEYIMDIDRCAKVDGAWICDYGVTKDSNHELQITGEYVGSDICVAGKARPKTEWELYPEDYVAETKCVEYEGSYSETCWDEIFEICYDSKPKLRSEKCEDLRTEIFQQCAGGGCLNCTDICIRNSTSYRLKSECEKGNPSYISEIKCTESKFNRTFVEENCRAFADDGAGNILGVADCPFDSPHLTTCSMEEDICRLKTDYEKLLDKDCDFIERELTKCNAFLYSFCITCYCEEEYHQDLRRAYFEKECIAEWVSSQWYS